MPIFNFLCTTFGKIATPKLKSFIKKLKYCQNSSKTRNHHISNYVFTCSPHFFFRFYLLTTFLFTVALAHHISFYFDKTCSTQIYNGCTCSPQFLFILRKQNTSKVANLFIKRIRHILFTVLKQNRVKVARLREN